MIILIIGNNRKEYWIRGRGSKPRWMITSKLCLYISKHWRRNNWKRKWIRGCLNKVNKFIESIIQDQVWTNTRNKCLKNNVPSKKDTKETMTSKFSPIMPNNKNKLPCKISEPWIGKFAHSITPTLIRMSITMVLSSLISSNRHLSCPSHRIRTYTVENVVRHT